MTGSGPWQRPSTHMWGDTCVYFHLHVDFTKILRWHRVDLWFICNNKLHFFCSIEEKQKIFVWRNTEKTQLQSMMFPWFDTDVVFLPGATWAQIRLTEWSLWNKIFMCLILSSLGVRWGIEEDMLSLLELRNRTRRKTTGTLRRTEGTSPWHWLQHETTSTLRFDFLNASLELRLRSCPHVSLPLKQIHTQQASF